MRGSVAVTVRGETAYVASYSLNTAGFYVINEWTRAVPVLSPDETIGATVLEAMRAARVGVPVPAAYPTAELVALLELAGVRTEDEFMKGARKVSARLPEERGALVVVPSVYRGRRQGFESLDEQAITIDRADITDEAVGRAVRLALARSS